MNASDDTKEQKSPRMRIRLHTKVLHPSMSWRKNKETNWNGIDQIRHIAWVSQDPYSCPPALYELQIDLRDDVTRDRNAASAFIKQLMSLKHLCARISTAQFTFENGVITITTKSITNFNDFMYQFTEMCSALIEVNIEHMHVTIDSDTKIVIPFKIKNAPSPLDVIVQDMEQLQINPETTRPKRKRMDQPESILYMNTFDVQTRDVIKHSDMFQVYKSYDKWTVDATNRLLWIRDALPKIAHAIHDIKHQQQGRRHFIVVADDAEDSANLRADNAYIAIFNMPPFSIDFIHAIMSIQAQCVLTTFSSSECDCLCIRYSVE